MLSVRWTLCPSPDGIANSHFVCANYLADPSFALHLMAVLCSLRCCRTGQCQRWCWFHAVGNSVHSDRRCRRMPSGCWISVTFPVWWYCWRQRMIVWWQFFRRHLRVVCMASVTASNCYKWSGNFSIFFLFKTINKWNQQSNTQSKTTTTTTTPRNFHF